MKLTKEEKLDIGRRMYEKELTYQDVMSMYDVSETFAHKCMTDYKLENSIPLQKHTKSNKTIISNDDIDMDAYLSMSKEQLIDELIKAKANELRAKKGYEVKGVGVNKEFIPLNNKNSK